MKNSERQNIEEQIKFKFKDKVKHIHPGLRASNAFRISSEFMRSKASFQTVMFN